MEKKIYLAPLTKALSMTNEGLICASGEPETITIGVSDEELTSGWAD